MANKPLKSIKYPGLTDTYTFVQIGTESGQAADAKVTRDEIEEITNELNAGFVKSANLFDKNSIVTNKVLDIGTGKTIESFNDSQLYNVSNIMPITAGSYVCSGLFDTDSARLNVYDDNGDYLGGYYGTLQQDGSYVFNMAGTSATQGRFSYRKAIFDASTFMFVAGSTLPSEYEPYGTSVNPAYVSGQIEEALDDYEIPDGTVTPTKTSFSEHDETTNLIDPAKLEHGYINGGVDGSVKSSSTMFCTPFIPLKNGVDYYYNGNYFYGGYYAFYDENKIYVSGGGVKTASDSLSSPFKIPANAKYGRFTIAAEANIPNAWLCETNQMSVKPDDYALEIVTKFTEEKPTDFKGEDIRVFTKILCIGDSLTDGFFNEAGGSRLIMRNRSYPTKLQALTGVECTNMGYAGYTSVQWYDAYQNEDLSGHDACIIQLGVNDQLQNVSESDMDTALANIINKVKTDNNGIKIFVATIIPADGYMTTAMRTRSQMIRDFVSNLDDSNVYLVDLWTYGHTDDLLAFDAGHLSAYGYLQLALDYKGYISYIIRNNPNDFRYVQFIGTNYYYNGSETTRAITY